jgi:glycerophosphoryl diester phosphodiesterase
VDRDREREPPLKVNGHRGDPVRFPENTLAGFEAARRAGADGIEFDVHATRDGHLVVLHDYDLARTTSGSGLVHERDLAYVRSLDAGSWFDQRFEGERVPLLEEVLELDGVGFELELKGLPTTELVSSVAGAVRNAGVLERVEFTGFHLVALVQLRSELPEACLGLFAPPQLFFMTDSLYEQIVISTAVTGGFGVVHVASPVTLDVGRVHDRGIRVQAGGLDSEAAVAAALAQGVDATTTDDPVTTLRRRANSAARFHRPG